MLFGANAFLFGCSRHLNHRVGVRFLMTYRHNTPPTLGKEFKGLLSLTSLSGSGGSGATAAVRRHQRLFSSSSTCDPPDVVGQLFVTFVVLFTFYVSLDSMVEVKLNKLKSEIYRMETKLESKLDRLESRLESKLESRIDRWGTRLESKIDGMKRM